MAEDCPTRQPLEAFASGGLSENEQKTLEAHLAGCLSCARELEDITQTQLEELVDFESRQALGKAPVPPLADLMRRTSENPTPSFDVSDIHEILDAPQEGVGLGRFAGYAVTDVAGVGGMGVVLKAHDPTLERAVALKILSPSRARGEESAARFLREARTIAAIQHDNVVVVHTAGREKGLPYLVMPFHAEGTLEQLLQCKPRLAPEDVIGVGIQLARALEVTHAQGILHRDIKPSNVLLEGGLERVRLADFGLAQPVSQKVSGAKGLIAGTPQYMSPEQARGEPIDARSDLFGLGAMLYHLATGQTVYSGKSSQEVLQVASEGKSKPVRELSSNVPPGLAAVIDRLLARAPEERFASATDVAEALTRLANRGWRRVKLAAGLTLAACLIGSATVAALDRSGRTALFNTLLCQLSGDTYFIRGRFGTYLELPDAVLAARPHDIVEVRYSGERVVRNFRVGEKPLTIRAADGFTPILYATNNAQPFILADGPLILEGLAFMRRAKGVAFTALIGAEDVPVALVNCRLIRSSLAAADVLIKAGELIPLADEERIFPPLIALDPGSQCFLRNCLVVGSQATAVALRGETHAPIRADVENSLFAIRRVFALRSVPGFRAELHSSGSVFASEELLDLGNAELIQSATATWTDCVFDLSKGTFVRLYWHGKGEWLRNWNWMETNSVYAKPRDFIVDRKGYRVASETEWNNLMHLPANGHAVTPRQLFAGVVKRASPQINARDANAESLWAKGTAPGFEAASIGEGKAYTSFRTRPEYRKWKDKVQAAVRAWQPRTASPRKDLP